MLVIATKGYGHSGTRGRGRRVRWWATVLSFAMSLPLVACGARSALPGAEEEILIGAGGATSVPACRVASDCPYGNDRCQPDVCVRETCVRVQAVRCDDGNACTEDKCDPVTGNCSFPPRTPDVDGDGFRAPLAGCSAGQPGSCGNE